MSRRIVVVGTSGSGKTTFARELAGRLGLPHVELDALHHGPNWYEPSAHEFRATIEDELFSLDGWVCCGAYHHKLGELVPSRADTLVWLDLPLGRQALAPPAPNALTPRAQNGTLAGESRVAAWRVLGTGIPLRLDVDAAFRGRAHEALAASPQCGPAALVAAGQAVVGGAVAFAKAGMISLP